MESLGKGCLVSHQTGGGLSDVAHCDVHLGIRFETCLMGAGAPSAFSLHSNLGPVVWRAKKRTFCLWMMKHRLERIG